MEVHSVEGTNTGMYWYATVEQEDQRGKKWPDYFVHVLGIIAGVGPRCILLLASLARQGCCSYCSTTVRTQSRRLLLGPMQELLDVVMINPEDQRGQQHAIIIFPVYHIHGFNEEGG